MGKLNKGRGGRRRAEAWRVVWKESGVVLYVSDSGRDEPIAQPKLFLMLNQRQQPTFSIIMIVARRVAAVITTDV